MRQSRQDINPVHAIDYFNRLQEASQQDDEARASCMQTPCNQSLLEMLTGNMHHVLDALTRTNACQT